MHILIVGAGGVGGFYGAHLLNAQREVTFLVRPKRAQHLAARGLRLLASSGNVHIANPKTVTAHQLQASPQAYDLILLSCKAYDLPSAMDDLGSRS